MRREMKFRAWDDTLCRMFNQIMTLEYIAKNNFNECNWYQLHIMQFTGLEDKNQKEIYEGDILHRDSYWDIYIVWDSNNSCFSYLCADWIVTQGKPTPISKIDLTQYEIIGNIYENAELLNNI